MHLLLTRPDTGPEPDSLHAALAAAGHTITHAPLLKIKLSGTMPSLGGVQALIATSRNGLRAVAPVPDAALGLPLLAVGPGTGALARELGFRSVIEGPGTGRELAELIRVEVNAGAGGLVHLAGDRLAFDLKRALEAYGYEVRTEIVYRTEAADALPQTVVDTFRQGSIEGVVLMSPRTAKIYAKLVGDAALTSDVRAPVHFCLSEAVARELAPLGAVRIAVARSPNSQEMLALIGREGPESA